MKPPEPPPKSRLQIALEITSAFEGAGLGGVAGNFDGMGLSAGALQWNYGKGTLQKLLKLYQDKHGLWPALWFPEDINGTSVMHPKDAVAFSERMQKDKKVKREWVQSWSTFLTRPEVVACQMELVAKRGEYAEKMMRSWHLDSTKAFCFFFDVNVQNGSMKGVKQKLPLFTQYTRAITKAKDNREIWSTLDIPDEETIILLRAAWDRSRLSHAKWRSDVFYRKGTIAMGFGKVHGKMYDFRDSFSE